MTDASSRCEPHMRDASTDSMRTADATRTCREEKRRERTDEEPHAGRINTADPNAHENYAKFAVSNILEDVLSDIEQAFERHPISRHGQREPIPWIVRCAVYYRDNGTCQLCGYHRPRPSQLDHATPWSAGGSDRSHNLRLTCQPCNQERSNYHHVTEGRRPPPVTWWCGYCWSADVDGCWLAGHYCRVPAVTRRGEIPADWHASVPHVDPNRADRFVYCAHCDDHGYTEARCVL